MARANSSRPLPSRNTLLSPPPRQERKCGGAKAPGIVGIAAKKYVSRDRIRAHLRRPSRAAAHRHTRLAPACRCSERESSACCCCRPRCRSGRTHRAAHRQAMWVREQPHEAARRRLAERLGAIVLFEDCAYASARSRSEPIGFAATSASSNVAPLTVVRTAGHLAANSFAGIAAPHATAGKPVHRTLSISGDTFANEPVRADSTGGRAPVLRSRGCSSLRHRAPQPCSRQFAF